jgi:phage nucleotide-binding protein
MGAAHPVRGKKSLIGQKEGNMDNISISKTSDISKVGKTMLVYGESGTGKSTLLGTLPGKTLILDVEGGLTVLRDKDVDRVAIPETLENLKAVFDALVSSDNIDYDNICLDSGTELEKFMLIRLAANSKNDGMPSMHDYGVVSFKMRDYMRKLRDLRERGVNVIVTCLEMPLELEQGDSTIRTRLYPMLARKLAPEICGLFDVVARLEISAKPGHEGKRFLRMDGNEKIIAKNRYGNGGFAAADLTALFKAVDDNAPAMATKAKPEGQQAEHTETKTTVKAGRGKRGE